MRHGFTLIEMMVVLAVIAILAMIAMPSIQGKLVRDQIIEAAKLADLAKAPVSAAWTGTKTLPADNSAAGLPVADKIVSNLVKSVAVDNGAIHLTFGNRANGALQRQGADVSSRRRRRRTDRPGGLGLRPRERARQDERQGRQQDRCGDRIPADELQGLVSARPAPRQDQRKRAGDKAPASTPCASKCCGTG